MKRRSLVVCLSVVLVVAALRAQEPRPTVPGFIAHEWGTFTSMQGADGVGLEGLQHEEERLPDFVYSRTEVRECPLRKLGYKGLEVPVEKVTRKMETPVIYFYAPEPMTARVRVDFVKGLISQWFPVVDELGPPELRPEDGPLDLSTVERSFLEWDIAIDPHAEASKASLPDVAAGDPWAYARETKAALVSTRPRIAPRRGPVEDERFLFYRGLGTFDLPLSMTMEAGSKGRLIASGEEDLPEAIAVEMRPDRGRFLRLGRIEAGKPATVDMDQAEWAEAGTTADRLGETLKEGLVAQGLYADEARAMVRTWARSWFRTPGLRVLYFLPRAQVDRILPLRIDPVPESIVRVLVGRLEVITPEQEEAVAADLIDCAGEDETRRQAALTRLLALDRFLEPHLRRAMNRSSDPVLRRSAEQLLEELSR